MLRKIRSFNLSESGGHIRQLVTKGKGMGTDKRQLAGV